MAYTAENAHWMTFCICVVASTAVFGLLKWIEHGPVLKLLSKIEETQSRFALSFQQWGVQDIFNMRLNEEMARRNSVNQQLISSGNEFSLLAETAASYLDPAIRRHWDFLKIKLDAGHRFRVLILDPFCDAKALRNKKNGIFNLIDPKLRLDLLHNLQNSYPANVQIRFTKEPYCSLFITDSGLIYDPYHVGKDSSRVENYFIAISITKSGDQKAYWLLLSHFQTLWDNSQTFENWINQHQNSLPPL